MTDLAISELGMLEKVDPAKYGLSFGEGARTPDARTHENVVRPWLYGNWWLLDSASMMKQQVTCLQLIGIGVRLTKMPTPHQCRIYGGETIHFRGSCLRVFVRRGRPGPFHAVETEG